MADTTTPYLGLVKPEVNGAQTENVWGFDLNTNFDKIDQRFSQLTLSEAPADGFVYGRSNTAWVKAAPLNNPVLTGNPTAPTPAPGDNDTSIATTAYVTAADALKANLASPAFTGNPTAPTPAPGDNDTSIATTAFVTAFGVAAGAVLPSNVAPGMNGTPNAGTSVLYSRGDHTHPSDTSRVAKAGDTMTGVLTITNSGSNALTIPTGGAVIGGDVTLAITKKYYLYYMSATNNAYISADGSGNVQFVTGITAPASRMSINNVGVVNVASTQASTASSTGALTVAGGIGVAGVSYFGSTLNVNGGVTLGGSLSLALNQTINFGGTAVQYGYASGWINRADNHIFYNFAATVPLMSMTTAGVSIHPATASTSQYTGALVTVGGVGVGGSLNAGGSLRSYGGQLFLQGHSNDPNQGAIFFNANQTIYLHNTGTSVSLGGVPLRLTLGGHVLGGNEWSLYAPNNADRLRLFHDGATGWIQAATTQISGPGGAPGTVNITGRMNCTSMASSGDAYCNWLHADGGRLFVSGDNQPNVVLYQPGLGYWTGIYADPYNLNFGNFNSSGGAINRHGYFMNTGQFYIGGSGYKPGGGAWADSSDARIKNVIGPYDNGLASILSINPVLYTFKGNDTPEEPQSEGDMFPGREAASREVGAAPYANSPHHQVAVDQQEFVGVIAQDVEAVFPRMVTHKDGFIDGVAVTDLRDIDTTPLVYALVNSCKELAARNDALEARIAILEGAGARR